MRLHREYDIPYSLRQPLTDKIRLEVQNDRLVPVQVPEAGVSSPLWPLPKPNGEIRLIVDYKRPLNPNLKVDHCGIPIPDDIFNDMQG